MLTNATLIRIDTQIAPTTGGQQQYATGEGIAIRGSIREDDSEIGYVGDARLKNGRRSIFRVTRTALKGLSIAVESEVTIVGDGDRTGSQTYNVWRVQSSPKGALSFVELNLLED